MALEKTLRVVAGGGSAGGKRSLAVEKAAGIHLICCDFAARANLSGCVSQAFICVEGEKHPKGIPKLVIKKN